MLTKPMKDLRDTSAVSETCHRTGEPMCFTRNGYSDLVVMSPEAYDKLYQDAQITRIARAVKEGVAAIERGEFRDADEMVADLMARHGL